MSVASLDDCDQNIGPLRLEALDWASRFAIGPVSEADRRAFDLWRASSPAHGEAFRNAAAFIGELRDLDLPRDRTHRPVANDNVTSTGGSLGREPRFNRRAFLGGGTAIAASLAAGLIVAQSPLGLWPTLGELTADERTGMGERRSLSPSAGVDIEMNARSSLSRIDNGIRLVAGEIFVAIAHQDKPFRIDAGDVRSLAQSAHLNVNVLDGELRVTCLDGTVSAARNGQNIGLRAGQTATWLADGTVRQTDADGDAVTGWRRGLLVFKGTPLAAAIGEINRYFPGRLVLRGSALNERPVTGVFQVNQIELAVVQIQQLTGATATRLPGGVVLLG